MADSGAAPDLSAPPDLAWPLADTVLVPAGEFTLGCEDARDTQCRPNEQPAHRVSLSPFAIERIEVTQAAYDRCVRARACTPPAAEFDPVASADRPVRFVSWEQARSYCAFVGRRLPTEAEWERAARGAAGRIYPWGSELPDCKRANFRDCGLGQPDAVGARGAGATPDGILDLAGNVAEWVADWFGDYAAGPARDPKGPDGGSGHVARNIHFGGFQRELRATVRWVGATGDGIGFRCAESR